MINFQPFKQFIANSELKDWLPELENALAKGLCTQRYGDLPDWLTALASLPAFEATNFDFHTEVKIGNREEISEADFYSVEKALRALIPWRKGPFSIFGIHLDTEWRSDWKWQRVLPHLSSLKNRHVLDVGCGNGYHCLRMLGEGAQRIIGIDPSPRFVVQFYMLKKLLGRRNLALPVDVLPLGIEQLPPATQFFDTTFSMGVFYHRRSPFDHLKELMDTLKLGGELVLETLVIDGGPGECLVPEGRYAKMNNVWFLPSVPTLLSWMKKIGFRDARCVDTNHTSMEEQRATEWMRFQSLSDFLDKDNPQRTVEGHPAPLRSVIIAKK